MKYYPEPTPVAIITTDGGNDDNAAPPQRPPRHLPPPFDYLHTSPLPAAAVDAVGGCECAEGACGAGCPCVVAHKEALDALADPSATVVTLLECGPACACACRSSRKKAAAAAVCGARTTQRGVCVPLAVARRPGKGLGLITLGELPRGAFVCEYAGEPVTSAEASARLAAADAAAAAGDDGGSSGSGHALLVARLVLPSGGAALRVSYDATRRGNVARFINHSCDGGNLELVFVTRKGELIPRVALFARRGIASGEELTFSYGGGGDSSSGGGGCLEAEGSSQRRARCACGSAACRGFLPREPV